MNISNATLKALNQGFQQVFMSGFGSVTPTYTQIAMVIQSKTKIENYGWLKELPGMREWIGARVIHNLEATSALLENKDWEHTISVSRTAIEDDELGIFNNIFSMQGEVVASHPDELVWGLLPNGFSTTGFDGQYFFDTDHVGYNAAGAEVSWSNTGGGAGQPWFLADLSKNFMKPLIFQNRKAPQFVSMTRVDDDNVFMNKEFVFGADARYVAGFGFHQLAFGSKATLDATNFKAARLALGTQRRPGGRPLPVRATHLIFGPSSRDAVEDLILTEYVAGTKNPLYKAVDLIESPWLG